MKKRQAEKELDWQHRGVDRQIIRRDSSHGTQPAGVERADEEIRHDASPRLLAELWGQCKARCLYMGSWLRLIAAFLFLINECIIWCCQTSGVCHLLSFSSLRTGHNCHWCVVKLLFLLFVSEPPAVWLNHHILYRLLWVPIFLCVANRISLLFRN